MADPGSQYQAGTHEERARGHHRARAYTVRNVTRGGPEEKVDERGYREDCGDGRTPGMELGGHRFDEGTETVSHRERREHREKRGEDEQPGARRIRLGG